jgi:hypothetical protein
MSAARLWQPALCAALLAGAAMARAAEHVDAGLLEFLGSVDSAGEDWNDYLAGNDVERVAKRARKAADAARAAAPPPQEAPPQQQGTPGTAGQGKQS